VQDQFHVYPYRRVPSSTPNKQKKSPTGKFKGLGMARLSLPLKWFTLEGLFFLISCLVLTKAHILGGISPFGLAFFAAVSSSYFIYFWPLLIVYLLGLALFYPTQYFMINASVIGAFVIWQLIIPTKFAHRWLVIPIKVFLTLMVVKIAWLMGNNISIYKLLSISVEALLAAFLALVFLSCLNILQSKKLPSGLSLEESVCTVIFCLSFTAGLMDFQIAGLQVGSIVSRYIIMLAAWIGAGGAGASLGAVLGILPSLIQINAPVLVGIYAFSGLLAGVFAKWNKIGVSLGFLLGNLILSIYLLDAQTVSYALLETGVAIVCLLLTPNLLALRLRSVPGWKNILPSYDDYSRYAEFFKLRINDISRTFEDLANAIVQQGPSRGEVEEERIQEIFQTVAKTVCADCSLFSVCWEQDFYKTYKNILAAFVVVEKNRVITTETLPTELNRRCSRARELTIMLNCLYETYRLDNYWRKKIGDGQELLVTQLKGTSEVLLEIATDIQTDGYFHEELELSIAANLDQAGFSCEDVQVWKQNEAQGMEIHLSLGACPGGEPCLDIIEPLLNDLVGEPLLAEKRFCGKELGDVKCKLRLMPLPALRVETGFAQEAKNQRQICGDSCGMFPMGNRKFVLILSDGMGVGIKAARESEAAVSLLERFLMAGFPPTMAVNMLNSLLLLRSEEETFATIDLAIIDLYTGETEFIKVGSAPSYIMRGEEIWPVHNNALPAGIIKEINIESRKELLQNGDILIMLTDGVLEATKQVTDMESRLVEFLQTCQDTSPDIMAQGILNQAKLNATERRSDDLSVLVAKLQWQII
jgi:stage II sporulation protein E